jgi:hypothetical protein
LLRFVKSLVFGNGSRPHKIWFGAGAGCRFIIDPASKSQRILGLDEAEISGLFTRLVPHARTFIDVGGSDGYYAVIALRRNPALTAISCEPQRHFEQQARETLRLNFPDGGPQLEWVSKQVGSGPEQVSLDALAEGRAGPVLVKIDVDGAELDVLNSGPTLLSRDDCRVILEVHSPDLETQAVKLLESYHFACRIVKNAWWRLFVPERRPIELNRWVFAEKSTAEPAVAPDRGGHAVS